MQTSGGGRAVAMGTETPKISTVTILYYIFEVVKRIDLKCSCQKRNGFVT